MNYFYLDASAAAKRFTPEAGTPLMNYFFARVPPQRMYLLHLGVAEVVSILTRKANAKSLSPTAVTQAFTGLDTEIINQPLIRKLAAEASLIDAAFPLIRQYSINATDAVLLRSSIDLSLALRANRDDLALVTADRRLSNAAQTEGLVTFNPELQTTAEFDLLIV